ncbi:MAG: hybrid sensor histidine kinase/response regulator [Acidobacteria bacterium]|nr:MAG: hybrid sensor histidine kinase/response regulator [Acidobacteriota bacterium]
MAPDNDTDQTRHMDSLKRQFDELQLECSRLKKQQKTNPYRELFERSADAILIIKGGQFVDCNQATVNMLRFDSCDQVLQTHPSELSPPTQPDGRDSREKADEMIALAFKHGNHRFEWDHRRADGEVFPVEVLLTVAGDNDERVLHTVWRDITERKQLEEQLLQSQKMEAVGQLAGGIAHDFNNLLVAIIGHSDLLESGLDDRMDLLARVHQIQHAATRAAGLVRQLLAFSRKQRVHQRVVDLNAILVDLEQLLNRLIGEDIRMTVVPADQIMPVKVDPGQMEQVIVNLVTNARDAMPEGGTIDVTIEPVILTEMPQGASLPIEPGHFALLSVRDTGAGMHEETISRAFEPFYTTKEVGQGTGLGLSTVYGIVRQDHGTVTISSRPNQGTTIKIFLPISAGQLSVAESTSHTRAPGGSETILVVEDEETVASLVTNVLEANGYTVLNAVDGLDALGVWELNDGPIDLVLTDVVMPNMGGVELVQELKEGGFVPKILFMSGYTNLAPDRLERLDEKVVLIEKPFSPNQLIERIREIMNGC